VEFKRLMKQVFRPAAGTSRRGGSSQVDTARLRLGRFLRTKSTIIGIIVIGCLVAIILVRSIADNNLNSKTPNYTTVLPKDKSISELGGWKRVSPPKKPPVFAFTDTVDTVPISVSEQPLPESFNKNNINTQVAELAQKFNATNKVGAGGVTVYICTSSKGPQSVIFTKNNVLVLIKSENKIQDASWASYAQSLN
jgi:hypothetical protein